ncbi:MAG: hypothetical protein ABH829_04040 [archaeon]
MVGLVASLWLVFVALAYLAGSAEAVSEAHRRVVMEEIAVTVSNDLVHNPGYSQTGVDWTAQDVYHPGLAHYDWESKSVEERVLDIGKVNALDEMLKAGRDKVREMYGLGKYNLSVGIEAGGMEYLDRLPDADNRAVVKRLVGVQVGGVEQDAVLTVAVY